MKRTVIFEKEENNVLADTCNVHFHDYGIELTGTKYVFTKDYTVIVPGDSFVTSSKFTDLHDGNTSKCFKAIKSKFPEARIYQFDTPTELFEWLING